MEKYCSSCNGRGEVFVQQDSDASYCSGHTLGVPGVFEWVPCEVCGGTGSIDTEADGSRDEGLRE